MLDGLPPCVHGEQSFMCADKATEKKKAVKHNLGARLVIVLVLVLLVSLASETTLLAC